MISNNQPVVKETRTYDTNKHQTIHLRRKEDQIDYRFMIEPNLPPLRLYDNTDRTGNLQVFVNIDEIKQKLPVTPFEERKRLLEQYNAFLTAEHVHELLRLDMLVSFRSY